MRRLENDLFRYYTALGIAVVVMLLHQSILIATGRMRTSSDLMAHLGPIYLVLWISNAVATLWLTHRVHRGMSPSALREMAARQQREPRWWEKLLGVFDAATMGTYTALVAASLTLWVAISDQYRDQLVVVLLCVVSVAASWACTAQSYAIHYLRLWAAGEDIDLGLEQPYRYDDFLTFAIQVGTLYGDDARIRSRPMRRAMRVQMVVSMFFNTVVLAMLASLLIR